MRPAVQNYTPLYFFVTSFFTLLYGIFILLGAGDKSVILHFNGNDVLLNKFEITILIKVALLVLALGYYVAGRLKLPLQKRLTTIHTAITLGCITLNTLLLIFVPGKYIENISFWLIVLALAAQLVFIANLALGISKRDESGKIIFRRKK